MILRRLRPNLKSLTQDRGSNTASLAAGWPVLAEVYRDYADKLHITSDERTNALIVRAHSDVIQQVEAMLKALDNDDPKTRLDVKTQDIEKAFRGRQLR